MKGIIQTEFSECCNAWVTILKEDILLPAGANVKEIFYFKCTKCKFPCHLKKKRKEFDKAKNHSKQTFPAKAHIKKKV